MAASLERLGETLSLTEEEEAGLVVPAGLWQSESGSRGFYVVGRVLSSKPFHPEALQSTLRMAFNPVVAWGSSVRIRVAIDVTKPLRCALKLRTVLGDERPNPFVLTLTRKRRLVDEDPHEDFEFQEQSMFSRRSIPMQDITNLAAVSRGLIQDFRPALVFVAETKCSSRHIERLKNKFNMHGISVDSRGKSGELALFWSQNSDVLLQSYSVNHIDVSVKLDRDQDWWHFSGIYGEPDNSRHPAPNTVWERLGRACANGSWSDRFPSASISHVQTLCSDHKAIHIKLKSECLFSKGQSKPWRFEAAWLQSPQCEQVVERGWRHPLWTENLDGISAQLDHCREQLKEEASSIRRELESMAADEETVWRQRSKPLAARGRLKYWVLSPPASQRFETNQIRKLKGEDGLG
ncbi:hypothetical protein Sango_0649700 [Sesamum angolense]|uniref:Uncharacterized protein n=1 Tax=Sesamum angolense TaxID=2727404 RepID=A0AAE1X6W2_9LAMI|nr:hypothetical protein Sango_0649700 [Sesamum angolense]